MALKLYNHHMLYLEKVKYIKLNFKHSISIAPPFLQFHPLLLRPN